MSVLNKLILLIALFVPALARAADFQEAVERGWVWAHLFVFVGGVLTSLTPCVYPLIPITVSVFGARASKSKIQSAALASAYIGGMAIMYSILGVVAALTGGIFGGLLQKPIVVFILAAFFILLAASMLGFYEIDLPPSLKTRFSNVGGRGFLGAFLMGLVAGVVAAPCTGPVLGGVLLFVATTKSALLGFSLLFSFALGMGVLFFLIAVFAVSLPKSGAWMDFIKLVFGIALIAVAAYFARPHLEFLKNIGEAEPNYLYVSLLLIVNGLLIYIAAQPLKSLAAKRVFKGVSVVVALWGCIMLIGHFDPPKRALSEKTHAAISAERIEWVKSEPEGIELAKKLGKPAMIDFWAEWCAACKELDAKTFTDPKIIEEAKRFVAIKLDVTKESDENDAVQEKYKVLGLPTIVFINSKGELVERRPPNGFVPPDKFIEFMKAVD